MAESKLVQANKKVERAVIDSYKKMEETVVKRFSRIEYRFVSQYLTHDGETVESAKERLKNKKASKQ